LLIVVKDLLKVVFNGRIKSNNHTIT